MFMGCRFTKRAVVNASVAAILARLFFMGMDGVDRFSGDWNRVTGADMPDSSRVREVVSDARSTFPDELDAYVARADADARNSRSLMDVIKSVAGIADTSSDTSRPLPYGTTQQLESPYDRFAD